MSTRMLQRRGLASEWAAVNPILGPGEIGFEMDTGEIRIGNGVDVYEDLVSPYVPKVGGVMTGTLQVPYLQVNPQDGVNEGGEIKLKGAGTHGDWIFDVYADSARIFKSSTGVGVTVDSTGLVNSSGQLKENGSRVYSAANPPPNVLRAGDTMTGLLTLNAGERLPAGQSLYLGQSSGNDAYVSGSGTQLKLRGGTGGLILQNNADNDWLFSVTNLGLLGINGSSAGIEFRGRDNSAQAWTVYLSGNVLRAYNGSADRLTVDANGQLSVHGTGAGLAFYGKDNDSQSYTWNCYGNVAGLYSSTAGGSVVQASPGSLGIYSAASGTLSAFHVGRAFANELDLATPSAGAQFFTNTAAGDGVLRVVDSAKVLRLGVGSGASILDLASGSAFISVATRIQGTTSIGPSSQEIILTGGAISHGIELGRTDSVASSPYIDFHAGATTVDHDVRVQASSGIGLAGRGILGIYAGNVSLNGYGGGTSFSIFADSTGGRGPEIALLDTKSGQATPNKYIRNILGKLEVVNSAYNSSVWQLDDSGNVTQKGQLLLGNAGTTNMLSVAWQGTTADNENYGIIGVTAPAGNNRAYYSMTASGNSVWGMGIGSDNKMRLGSVATGKAMGANVLSIDASGNISTPGTVTATGGLYDGANRAYSAGNVPPITGHPLRLTWHATGTPTGTGYGIIKPRHPLPRAITIKAIYAVANSGSGAAVQIGYGTVAGSESDLSGAALSSIGTTLVSATGLNINVAAGNFLALQFTALGTDADISVHVDAVYQ